MITTSTERSGSEKSSIESTLVDIENYLKHTYLKERAGKVE